SPARAASRAGLKKRARRSLLSLFGMDLKLSQCFVIVHDPDTTLSFYPDTLGLEVRNDVANEGFRWITVGAPSQPAIAIVLTHYLNRKPAALHAVARLVAQR